MPQFFFGTLAFGVLIGFMMGASSTPVVGAAMTALLGVVVALVGGGQVANLVKSKAGSLDEGAFKVIAKSGGLALIALSVGCGVGLGLGAKARIDGWLAPEHARAAALPWAEGEGPTDVTMALDWVLVQDHLLRLGYQPEAVARLYALERAHPVQEDRPMLSRLFGSERPESMRLQDYPVLLWNQPIPERWMRPGTEPPFRMDP